MKLTITCLLIAVLVVFSACAKAPEAPPTEEEEEAPPPAAVTEEDVEAARQVVFAYVGALNSYDVEGALACLEESYRQEREESLTGEIGQMESFSITLGVEEEAEPVISPDETVGIYIKLAVPMGQPDRHVIYHLVKINEEWKINQAEE